MVCNAMNCRFLNGAGQSPHPLEIMRSWAIVGVLGILGILSLWVQVQELPRSPHQEIPPLKYLFTMILRDADTSFEAFHVMFVNEIFPQLGVPGSSVHVSIWEDGSTDGTKDALLAFEQSLNRLHVQNTIEIHPPVCGFSDRIDRLAHLRNIALNPLYESRSDYDVVIFINDVYFTSHDFFTLLHTFTSSDKVDMVCGLDFDRSLYDRWVLRDLDGQGWYGWYPFVKHRSDEQKVYAGEAFQVASCWNGLVVVNASHVVPFRSSRENPEDCIASECLLFCQDLREFGHGGIYVHPEVRVGYFPSDLWLQQWVMKPFLEPLLRLLWEGVIGGSDWWVMNSSGQRGFDGQLSCTDSGLDHVVIDTGEDPACEADEVVPPMYFIFD